MADTTEIRTRDLRARTPTRLPLRFLTPPTGVQADQAEKKTSPRNDGPTEIRTRDPRVRSPTLYRYATPPTPLYQDIVGLNPPAKKTFVVDGNGKRLLAWGQFPEKSVI